jgi:hypothetical protein
MGTLTAGQVVIVHFPFSDLTASKLRPAVVLAEAGRGDWIHQPDFLRGGDGFFGLNCHRQRAAAAAVAEIKLWFCEIGYNNIIE